MGDIRFRVDGRIVPKARPRVTKGGWAYTPKTTVDYEKRIRDAWEKQSGKMAPEGVALGCYVVFHFGIPKSIAKKKKEGLIGKAHFTSKDIDNCIKSVLDALNGKAYKDDSQIAVLMSTKEWSEEEWTEVGITWKEEKKDGET